MPKAKPDSEIQYSHDFRMTLLKRSIPARVKALLNREEVELALGRGESNAWEVIHESLRRGIALQISNLPDAEHTHRKLSDWKRRNVEKFPVLERLRFKSFKDERRLVAYFEPL